MARSVPKIGIASGIGYSTAAKVMEPLARAKSRLASGIAHVGSIRHPTTESRRDESFLSLHSHARMQYSCAPTCYCCCCYWMC